jgi:hypothetical protein
MRRVAMSLVVVASLCLPLSSARAAQHKSHPTNSATLELSEGSVAAGIGFSWGGGTLTYRGKKYPVSVEGLTVGSVGVSKATARGDVTNLKKLEDFNGNYAALKAGATVGGGGSVATMQNQNGVKITLKSTSKGVKLTLGTQGVSLKLKE